MLDNTIKSMIMSIDYFFHLFLLFMWVFYFFKNIFSLFLEIKIDLYILVKYFLNSQQCLESTETPGSPDDLKVMIKNGSSDFCTYYIYSLLCIQV